MLPSCALLALSGFSLGELTEDPRLRTEVWRLADERELGAEFLILREMPGRKVELTCDRERPSRSPSVDTAARAGRSLMAAPMS